MTSRQETPNMKYYYEIEIFRSGLLSGVKKRDFIIGRLSASYLSFL